MRSIKLNKKEYAIGFWWQILDGKGGKKLSLEKARKVSGDFPDRNYNCVVPRKQQFGLGSCDSAKVQKLPSLACALVERSRSTWIGMFCLNEAKDLWWICAVSKKTIVAEGDQYFSSRGDAEAHLKSLKALSDWEKHEVICGTFEESLKHFDGLLKPKEQVQSLAAENARGKVLAIAASLSLLVMGWFLWSSHQSSILEEQQRIAALEARLSQNKQQVEIEKNPAQLFTMSWKGTPLPSGFAEEFLKAIRNTEPFNNGWKLNSIVRNDSGIYMSWLHQDGAQFTNRPSSSSLGTRPDLAEITIDYPKDSARPEQSLIKKSDATAQLYELTRNLGAKLNLTWKIPEVKKTGKSTQIASPWIKGEWKLSSLPASSTISEDLFTEMDTIPCLVVSQISFTRNECTMEGQIYATN